MRAWLLRKNYINLREAARVLQGAWREKKKSAFPAVVSGGSSTSGTNRRSASLGSGVIMGVEEDIYLDHRDRNNDRLWRRDLGMRGSGGKAGIDVGAKVDAGSARIVPVAANGASIAASLGDICYMDDSALMQIHSGSVHAVDTLCLPSSHGNPSAIASRSTHVQQSINGSLAASATTSSAVIGAHQVDVPQSRVQAAAATLQAATRAMIARRRKFSTVRKQMVASLVIQKSLIQWWAQSKKMS